MPDRLCLVTNAMCTLAGTRTELFIHRKTVRLSDGKITDSSGRLAGAHISMDTCVRNMIDKAGVAVDEAINMASTNPARVLGLEHELGFAQSGYRASLTLLNEKHQPIGIVVDGRFLPNPKKVLT